MLNDELEKLYNEDKQIIENINDENFILKSPVFENENNGIKSYSLEKENFQNNQQGLTNLIRTISKKGYDKYGNENLYVLIGKGMKNLDIVNLLFEYQTSNFSKKEKIDHLKIIKKEINKMLLEIK